MTKNTFDALWTDCVSSWLNKATVLEDGKQIYVSDLCQIKEGYSDIIWQRYETIKNLIKDLYFQKDKGPIFVSLYKRAAIIAKAVNGSSPLIYKRKLSHGVDPYFLKQRFAFYLAIGSIIQGFPKEKVEALIKSNIQLFDFEELDKIEFSSDSEFKSERDDFLMSIYKDMFFSEVYENYNILTMANVFGLLTERASQLPATMLQDNHAKHSSA